MEVIEHCRKKSDRPDSSSSVTITNDREIIVQGLCRGDTGNKLQLLKMLCLTVLPILGLWGFSVYTITDKINKKTENEKTKFDLQLSVELGKLIHHLQQERDMSVLYLSDLGPETKTFLMTEYLETDKVIYALSEWPADLDNKKRSEFESRSKLQEHLSFHRKLLAKHTYDLQNEVDFYTSIIDVVVVWLYKSITRGQFAVVWKTLVAYLKLTSGKQDIGIERAYGTLFYIQGGFKQHAYFEMYNNRINRFKAFYTTAELYSKRVDRLYTSGVKMLEENITGIINNFRYEIQHHEVANTFPNMEKARYWFDNMTIYLDTLFDIQRNLGYEIIEILDVVIQETTRDLSVSAGFLCVVLVMCALVIYITESLTSIIQKYATTLLTKTREFTEEKNRNDGLLYQMVPPLIADKIKKSLDNSPEFFNSVTILFTDIYGFDKISTECTPKEIVVLMNSLYGNVDDIVDTYNVYKVETIKDCYMVASGLPTRNEDKHVSEIADLALDMLRMIQTKRFSVSGNRYVQLLIGINTGPCMAGIVGSIMPRYCVLGKTVNVASKMKTYGYPNKIHISSATNAALMKTRKYVTKKKGLLAIKHLETYMVKSLHTVYTNFLYRLLTFANAEGKINTFWLIGKSEDSERVPCGSASDSVEIKDVAKSTQYEGMQLADDTFEKVTSSDSSYRDEKIMARIIPTESCRMSYGAKESPENIDTSK